MRRNVHHVVPIVSCRIDGVVQARRRMSKRRIDEPQPAFTVIDGPSIPGPRAPRLLMPGEVSDVAGFEVNHVSVERMHDRDPCVRPALGLCSGLCRGPRSKHCTHEKRCAGNRETTMVHELLSCWICGRAHIVSKTHTPICGTDPSI